MTDNSDSTQFRCTYCGQRNQISESRALETARCGRCRLPYSSVPHKKFAQLDPDSYIHPQDSQALAALRAIPGVDTVLKKLIEFTGESYLRVMATANTVQVGPNQDPDLDAKLDIVCCTLGVSKPDLYVTVTDPIFGTGMGLNAMTTGVEKPLIIGYSSLLERLDDKEILAVLAHEVGHIHAEHVLYLTAARLLEFLAKTAVLASPLALIVKEILTMSMRAALLAWARRAELSCDRAALLVTQDANVIGRTMMKLSGGTFASRVDYDQFLAQARDVQKNYDEKALDRFGADAITSGLSHPFPVWRVSEILQWVESGEYKALITAPESAAA